MEVGLQLYSVRDVTEGDLPGTLRKVARMGYQAVEFAGFFGHSAEDVAQMLADCGLKAHGTHTGLSELTEHFSDTVHFHQLIGCEEIIIPWADLTSREKLDRFLESTATLSAQLLKEGLRLGYHNHADEFKRNEDGSVAFDELSRADALFLEIDTFWAFAAGRDPVALLKGLHSRVPVIHIKDGLKDGSGKPLGLGEAPVKAVWQTARELGMRMVVESETLTPDGLTAAQTCIDYLRALEV